MGEIPNASAAVIVGDGVMVSGGSLSNIAYRGVDFDLRHDKKVIIGFADGHVAMKGTTPSAYDLSATDGIENWFLASQATNLPAYWKNAVVPPHPFPGWSTDLAPGAAGASYVATSSNLNGEPSVSFSLGSQLHVLTDYRLGSTYQAATQFFTYYTASANTSILLNDGGWYHNIYLKNDIVMTHQFMYPYFSLVSPDTSDGFYNHYGNTGVNGVGAHTICFVSGNGLQLYVDSKLAWNRPTYFTIYTPYDLVLGCSTNGSGVDADSRKQFVGEYAEYVHYGRAMSASEVAEVSYYLKVKYGTP